FDLNDAEQLRFIAEQLENVGTHVENDDGLLTDGGDGPAEGYAEDPYDVSIEDLGGAQDPNMQLRIQSMPILDNLSTQILATLGKGTYQDTFNIVTQPESDQGQAYRTLTALFDQTKKLYTHDAFLSAGLLRFAKSPRHRFIVRKANMATFISSVFGSTEVGFFHLNEYFLETFVPDGGRLLKSQGALYLDLKTQAFISAMGQGERTKEEILEDLFPDDLDQYLIARRSGSKGLTPSEQDFVSRCRSRRAILAESDSPEALSEKYVWQNFLKEVSDYVSRNYQQITAVPGANKRARHASAVPEARADAAGLELPAPADAGLQLDPAIAAASAPAPDAAAHRAYEHAGAPAPAVAEPVHTPRRAAPARAGARSATRSRAPGGPSNRRPWTKEEETALMHGLDEVKGPRWSQILEMYGPGGHISEVLKDRTQVQLKDKARNLKLFFLKSGLQVPVYLQFVTGELKNRPSSAGTASSPAPTTAPSSAAGSVAATPIRPRLDKPDETLPSESSEMYSRTA
ncbi:telomere repeat binding factor-domain-containing protein, partial [Dipodascopsis tothii]|uniref:telomere repeat binding factor-domain-containing protein n=1 Tax=Dipodascopsis tothii TaxID=44089 RepID=UPI0034D02075